MGPNAEEPALSWGAPSSLPSLSLRQWGLLLEITAEVPSPGDPGPVTPRRDMQTHPRAAPRQKRGLFWSQDPSRVW